MILITAMAGCTPRYVVPLSSSYTQAEFAKMSKGYDKTVNTKYEEQITFDDLHIHDHTVYITTKDSLKSTKAIPLKEISSIDLMPKPDFGTRVFATVAGTVIGMAAGLGLARVIDSQHITSGYLPIFDILLTPLGGVMGGTVGNTVSQKNIYNGKYRIVKSDTTYQFKPVTKQQSTKRPGVIMDN